MEVKNTNILYNKVKSIKCHNFVEKNTLNSFRIAPSMFFRYTEKIRISQSIARTNNLNRTICRQLTDFINHNLTPHHELIAK